MHILHICNDFIGTKVHVNLFKGLAKQGLRQTIYCPIKDKRHEGNNAFVAEGTDIVYDFVFKSYHRYFYHLKRHDIFRSLQRKVNLKNVDVCHAATLLSDGGQAYKIYQKYHIPYIVAVRNTDINVFLDRAPNTWIAARKILKNAAKIIFISQALLDRFSCHNAINSILPDIKDKMMLIPNGIDDYFLDHVNYKPSVNRVNKVLYVGDFTPNKNVVSLCDAVLQLSKQEDFRDIRLTLVGGVGKLADENVFAWIKKHPEIIDYVGPVYDKDKLCEIFNKHGVFAMPSFQETFGLVYLEALSQNLPVVFTKGQAIDGIFPPNVGIAVNPTSIFEIKEAIKDILQNKSNYSNEGIDFEKFRWDNITKEYVHLYYGI